VTDRIYGRIFQLVLLIITYNLFSSTAKAGFACWSLPCLAASNYSQFAGRPSFILWLRGRLKSSHPPCSTTLSVPFNVCHLKVCLLFHFYGACLTWRLDFYLIIFLCIFRFSTVKCTSHISFAGAVFKQ